MNGFLGFTSIKNRVVDSSKPVLIYRNLTKKCFSVRQGTLVVGHCEGFVLKNFDFKISEAARQKVIETKQKNVHAFIRGYVIDNTDSSYVKMIEKADIFGEDITYNPYRFSSFVYQNLETKVDPSLHDLVKSDGRYLYVL